MSGPLGTSGGGAAGVTSVTAGNGITVTGTTTPTIAASLAAGTGVSIAGTTTLTVTNTGVTSLVAGTNISTSGTGAVTVNAPAFGTTITASTIGGTAAAGTSTTVAREDHKHAFPAGAAPAALLVGSTQATGTSTAPALADHVHAMPGSAVAGASAVGDTAATGSATTVALSDHRHSREAFGTPVVVNAQTTSLATGSLTTLARADHVHTVSNVPVLLGATTLTSQSSVTFSSIPQTYTVLYLFGAGIYGTITTTVTMTVNSVTSGYADTWVYWEHNGTTLSSGKLSSASGASQTVQSMFSTANQGMVFHVWFPNYATSGTITRYWNLRGQRYNVGSPDSVQERIGGGQVSAAPITSVTITASSGTFSAGRLILMGY